jgi:hypothetical protein
LTASSAETSVNILARFSRSPGAAGLSPEGENHDAKVHGDKALKVLGIYIVDKTKPLASPAP